MDCVFCQIVRRDIPATVVLEDDNLIAIKDINPQPPTHLLIIPKKHYATLLECKDPALLGNMLLMAVDLSKKLGINETGFRVVINTNKDGGQTVFHLHMHLLGGKPLSDRMA